MEVKNRQYEDYNTVRQWAKRGFLPTEDAKGVKLWANKFCQDCYTYYSKEEVREATAEELKEFFKPERERKNRKAKARRDREREQRRAERERKEQERQRDLINAAIKPYLDRIIEQQKIIKAISAANVPSRSETNTEHKCVVIDTETTGLDPERDELLQVSIIDTDGNTLFDSYFKPCCESWAAAERINGISPEMVKNAPRISEKIAEINAILYQSDTVIGYNIHFDINFLANNGLILADDVNVIDVMEKFAVIYGEWNDYFESYTWQELTTAAAYYDYDWNSRAEGAHNSLADCYATLHVYNHI